MGKDSSKQSATAAGQGSAPFSHLNAAGEANMVDVSGKAETRRVAVASAAVRMAPETLTGILDGNVPKGDVIAVARVAGIQAAKRCAELIPLCHPLSLSRVELRFEAADRSAAAAAPAAEAAENAAAELRIEAEVTVTGKTGVEMEALTAVSVAALTIYDMCKAADKAMVIRETRLERKLGGKSGDWERPA